MNLLRSTGSPFYLTGGTALNRYYFRCRYSDDLDFFVNNDGNFSSHVQKCFDEIEKHQSTLGYTLDYDSVRKTESFSQLVLRNVGVSEVNLKIDFVNDIASHYGEFKNDEAIGKIDSIRNILSNKITALFRFEAKDIVDLWMISKNYYFEWKELLREAKTKDAGMEAIAIVQILRSFPLGRLDRIKWAEKPDYDLFKTDLDRISDDIFYGRENSLNSKEGRVGSRM
jgi:predicted nucleotidyltransferase component of viral defense system